MTKHKSSHRFCLVKAIGASCQGIPRFSTMRVLSWSTRTSTTRTSTLAMKRSSRSCVLISLLKITIVHFAEKGPCGDFKMSAGIILRTFIRLTKGIDGWPDAQAKLAHIEECVRLRDRLCSGWSYPWVTLSSSSLSFNNVVIIIIIIVILGYPHH